MSDAITLDVLSSSPVQLDAGDADPIAREEIAALAGRVTTVEGDVTALDGRMDAAEGDISTLGTTVDGIDARVEAIEADYVTSEDVMDALGGEAPALVAGSSRAMLGDPETASWMQRTTAADGAALIESVKGNTLRWNQLCGNSPDEYTITIDKNYAVHVYGPQKKVAGHKYFVAIDAKISVDSTMVFQLFMSDNTYETKETPSKAGTTSYVRYAAIFSAGYDNNVTYFGYRNTTYVSSENVQVATKNPTFIDLTAMFGAGNEPATVAEFEALFPKPYYPYDPGSLLPVRMEGVETVAADESWSSQLAIPAATYFPQGMRSAGSVADELRADAAVTRVGAVDLGTLDWRSADKNGRVETTGKFVSDVAISGKTNMSIPDIATDAPYTVRNFYGGDSSAFLIDKSISIGYLSNAVLLIHDADLANKSATEVKAALAGKMLHYVLATPTVTHIDPPLPLSYRTGAGGTERVMVASGTTSAPPVFATRYPLDPADLAASIAPRESATAEANHAVGDLIMLGWTLCKVTTAIARGEAITIGTNVTRTSVAAELAAIQ